MTGSPPQSWSANLYARHASFVPDQGAAWVASLGSLDGLDVLDLGCGDGVLTKHLLARGARVVGVDASDNLVAAARSAGIDAHVVDGRELTFDGEFDLVFSHAALHWMKPPEPVLRGVRKSLRPGGRFVADMGGSGNVAHEAAALEAALDRRGYRGSDANPWFFPEPDEYRRLLQEAGFSVDGMSIFERPTPISSDIEGWLATFAESFLSRVDPSERPQIVAEVADALRPHLSDSKGNWTLDYVLLRFAARVPEAAG